MAGLEDIKLTVGVTKARAVSPTVSTPTVSLLVQDRRAVALSVRSASTLSVQVVEVI